MYLYHCSFLILAKIFITGWFLLLLFPIVSFAQTATGTVPVAPTTPTITKGVVTANINLANAKVLEQTDSRLVVEFVLENKGNEPEFDIRYGVELMQTQEGGAQTIADSYVSSEILTISPKQKMVKKVEYPLTGIAPGTYSIWVSAKTTGGVMLGLGNAGTFIVKNTDAIEIKASTCTLNVSGENKTYNLYQGVDIANTESLILDCMVKNHSENERTLIPLFETYRRTVFGEKVAMTYPEESAISIAPYEEKNIILNVPIASEPQAYDATINFVDEKTKVTASNRLVLHYVTQGVSATIQTVSLDKSYYATGDKISLEVFWTPSADSFAESRIGEGTEITGNVTAYVQILDEANKFCSEKILRVMDKPTVRIETTAISNCVKPKAEIILIGPDGTTLDMRQIAVQDDVTPDSGAEQNEGKAKNSGATDLMTVSIIAFAIAFTTILFIVFRKKRTNTLV